MGGGAIDQLLSYENSVARHAYRPILLRIAIRNIKKLTGHSGLDQHCSLGLDRSYRA